MPNKTPLRQNVQFWIGFVLTVAFTLVGMTKVVFLPFEVHAFEHFGLPLWLMFAVGVFETVCGLTVSFRRFALWSSLGISLEMVVAFFLFLAMREPGMILLPVITIAISGSLFLSRLQQRFPDSHLLHHAHHHA